jgi:hypothetical protein
MYHILNESITIYLSKHLYYGILELMLGLPCGSRGKLLFVYRDLFIF